MNYDIKSASPDHCQQRRSESVISARRQQQSIGIPCSVISFGDDS